MSEYEQYVKDWYLRTFKGIWDSNKLMDPEVMSAWAVHLRGVRNGTSNSTGPQFYPTTHVVKEYGPNGFPKSYVPVTSYPKQSSS